MVTDLIMDGNLGQPFLNQYVKTLANSRMWLKPNARLIEFISSHYFYLRGKHDVVDCNTAIAIRELRMEIMPIVLKPQDVVVLLKLCGYNAVTRPAYSLIAGELGMSQSEINASVKRLQAAGLVNPKELGEMPILAAAEEFLIHAVKYVFPAKRGHYVRGLPTSYAAKPLSDLIVAGDDPIPVWPDPLGKKKGLSLMPLYRSVPDAARRDPILYERLAMLDAIRDGGARERKLAETELIKSLRRSNG